jgi:hypothetical protein
MFSKISDAAYKGVQITRTLTVSTSLTWDVTVDEKEIPSSAELFSDLPNTISSVQDLQLILEHVHGLVSCSGNEDKRFQPLLSGRNGTFMNKSGNAMYTMQVRGLFVH